MEDVSTPSINAELMPRFVNQRVRLVVEIDNPGDGQTIVGRCASTNTAHLFTALAWDAELAYGVPRFNTCVACDLQDGGQADRDHPAGSTGRPSPVQIC